VAIAAVGALTLAAGLLAALRIPETLAGLPRRIPG
jgi:hypothetical protein